MKKVNLKNKTLFQLESLRLKHEDDPDATDEFCDEIEAEITKRKEGGVKFAVSFNAVNNDTYEDGEQLRGLYEQPKNRGELRKIVESTYDGVWEPQMNTIQLFQLTPVI